MLRHAFRSCRRSGGPPRQPLRSRLTRPTSGDLLATRRRGAKADVTEGTWGSAGDPLPGRHSERKAEE